MTTLISTEPYYQHSSPTSITMVFFLSSASFSSLLLAPLISLFPLVLLHSFLPYSLSLQHLLTQTPVFIFTLLKDRITNKTLCLVNTHVSSLPILSLLFFFFCILHSQSFFLPSFSFSFVPFSYFFVSFSFVPFFSFPTALLGCARTRPQFPNTNRSGALDDETSILFHTSRGSGWVCAVRGPECRSYKSHVSIRHFWKSRSTPSRGYT